MKRTPSPDTYRAIFEGARTGMVLVNRDGVIVDTNPRWSEIVGVPREQLVGRAAAESSAIHPPNFASTEPETLVPLVRGDGTTVHVELSRTTIDVDGEPHLLVLGQDVTERHGRDEARRQAQKMEAVSHVAGGIAHDFNNSMTIILSYCELVLAQLQADDPMRGDIDEIGQAARRASGLIRQLLTFSRRQVLEPQVLDVDEVLARIDDTLRQSVGDQVELVTSPGASVGRVFVDPANFEQVILNLAVNAREAMPRGGKVTVATANADVDGSPRVVLSVTDEGVGMDRETQARIFEPFFTTKKKRMGLGLSTALAIVEQSDGSIVVESEVGKGSTFRVSFPRLER